MFQIDTGFSGAVAIDQKLIEENYNIEIVFSGARGFHIHVLYFARDWMFYNERPC
ncbi:MAG: hypothetical protein ACPL07_01680 [Candidatus Bathyarchaeia archaeon]